MADRQETLGVENTTTKTAGPRTFHLMWPQLEGKVHFVYLFKNKKTKKNDRTGLVQVHRGAEKGQVDSSTSPNCETRSRLDGPFASKSVRCNQNELP